MKHRIVCAVLVLVLLAIVASGCGLPGGGGSGGASGGGARGGGASGGGTPATQIQGLPSSTSSEVDQGMRIIDGIGRVEVGYLYIPGVVENTTDKWVMVMLHVYLYDSAGSELEATTMLGKPGNQIAPWMIVPPHGKGPFFYLNELTNIKGAVAGFKLAVDTVAEQSYHPEAAVADVKWAYDAGFVDLTGKLTSKAGDPCTAAGAAAIAYTADGKIYRVEIAGLEDDHGNTLYDLNVGQTGSFDYLIDDSKQVIAKVEVYASCGLVH